MQNFYLFSYFFKYITKLFIISWCFNTLFCCKSISKAYQKY